MAKETSVISQKTLMRISLLITKLPCPQLSLASPSVLAHDDVHFLWMEKSTEVQRGCQQHLQLHRLQRKAGTSQSRDKTGRTFRLHFLPITKWDLSSETVPVLHPKGSQLPSFESNPSSGNWFQSILYMDIRLSPTHWLHLLFTRNAAHNWLFRLQGIRILGHVRLQWGFPNPLMLIPKPNKMSSMFRGPQKSVTNITGGTDDFLIPN